MTSKIEEAQNTCDGLYRLIRRLHGAAVDLDKGGESAHEILALLASTSICVETLSSLLDSIPPVESNVSLIKSANGHHTEASSQSPSTDDNPEQIRAVAGRY